MSDKKDMKPAWNHAGTASDLVMKRSVLRNVRKRPEGVLFGAMSGADAAWLKVEASENVMIRSSGFSSSELPEPVGTMAYKRAVYNMAAEGGRVTDIQVYIQAGRNTPEDNIRSCMHELTELTKKENVSISGGNTVYTGNTKDYNIVVSALGVPFEAPEDSVLHTKINPNDRIVFYGSAGEYGASLLASHYAEELTSRFPASYIRDFGQGDGFFVPFLAKRLIGTGKVKKLHDVSFGGVYEALFQLSNYAGLGLNLIHEGITIRQEVIEISEFYNINPYMLLGTGALLAVVSAEDEALFTAEGGTVVGSFSEKAERRIVSTEFQMNRILTPAMNDEIYRVLLRGRE